MNINNFFWENDYIFKTKKLAVRVALLYIFANVFNVWLNTAGFLFLLPHRICFDILLGLKYMEYTYMEYTS